MKSNENRDKEAGAQFHTTNWSAVLLSAQTQVQGSQTALADLCRVYWLPLYSFVRRRGYSSEDAQDLTQGFFFSLLERKSLRQVEPEKGKFRSFLLAALKNYLSDAFDRENCLKRGGNIEFVALDFEDGEQRFLGEPSGDLTAEQIFDARWAITLLGNAIEKLRSEYVSQGKANIIEILGPFLHVSDSRPLPSYEQIAEKLHLSVGGVKTLVHRLRKQYTQILRKEVAMTVVDPGTIDEEIHALCDALIASRGQWEA
jgi:RNA polymerase sigma factor (sigma-70 family)